MAIHYVEPNGTEPSSQISIVSNEEPHVNDGVSDTSEPETKSTQLSSPEESDTEPVKPKYSPRVDRMNQKPSKGNAQGLFLPDSCVFVGNLSIKVPLEQLEEDLTTLVSPFGKCHVKVRMTVREKALPVGFVQFEDIKCAKAALKRNGELKLHNRTLRLETSKARRTAFFGYLTNAPITRDEVLAALKDRGSLENLIIKDFVDRYGNKSTYGLVTFAYPDDYSDALTYFNSSRKYYMIRTEMDSNESQFPQDYPGPGYRSSNHFPPTRGNHQRYNNNRRGFNRPWYNGNNRGSLRGGPGAPLDTTDLSRAIIGFNGGFNPGYPSPNFNTGYNGNKFPQNYPGSFPQVYPPPNFAPPFAGPHMMMAPMPVPEVQPPMYPADYTAVPNPGHPMFMGNQPFPPPNYMPPIVASPQPASGIPGCGRLPPGPDSPLVVSSQPQFDTDEHVRRFYEPVPGDNYACPQPGWVGNPAYMHPGYNQPAFLPGFQFPPRSRHSSTESKKRDSPAMPSSPRTVIVPGEFDKSPEGVNSESSLINTELCSPGCKRGRQLARDRHATTTDGGSSVPPSVQTAIRASSAQASDHSQEGVSPTDVTQSAAPASDNKTLDSQGNSTEPEEEPIHTGADGENKELPIDEMMASLKIESKHDGSVGSSSEAGLKTPDTDESRELAKGSLQTPAADGSTAAKTPGTAETPEPTEGDTPSKSEGKGKATATSTSPKTIIRRLEPALPDDKHLQARHAFQHRKPLKKKYQPKTDTGKTVEQYTREINAQRAAADPSSRVPEHLMQEVIAELEEERRAALKSSQGLSANDKSGTDSATSAKK
ncbi:hypothetical protein N7535_008021 [Penicillium sp. DV-2018c]|nr:hypothetical protein N7461_004056 [Penicillium sp. DV-2018c]KAJ5566383.1 hypothetical protein N7535_008021 [Penicillium sp. DV-2018c]